LSDPSLFLKAHVHFLTPLPSGPLHFLKPLFLFKHLVGLQIAGEFVNFLLDTQLFCISSQHSLELVVIEISLEVPSLLFLHLSSLSSSPGRPRGSLCSLGDPSVMVHLLVNLLFLTENVHYVLVFSILLHFHLSLLLSEILDLLWSQVGEHHLLLGFVELLLCELSGVNHLLKLHCLLLCDLRLEHTLVLLLFILLRTLLILLFLLSWILSISLTLLLIRNHINSFHCLVSLFLL